MGPSEIKNGRAFRLTLGTSRVKASKEFITSHLKVSSKCSIELKLERAAYFLASCMVENSFPEWPWIVAASRNSRSHSPYSPQATAVAQFLQHFKTPQRPHGCGVSWRAKAVRLRSSCGWRPACRACARRTFASTRHTWRSTTRDIPGPPAKRTKQF